MKIIVDAMGGDFAPLAPVKGALMAQEKYGVDIVLTGKTEEILKTLQQCGCKELPKGMEIANATEVVEICDDPATAFKHKKDSSLTVGLNMLHAGDADGFVSAGSTGAVLAGATLIVKRIPGILRPALAPVIPGRKKPFLLIDCGANVDCQPRYLQQFGLMGSVYMQSVQGVARPEVGLANIGTEAEKGDKLTREAYELMSKQTSYVFKGNAEVRDVPNGDFDVVVADGFVGNVILKTIEGVSGLIMGMLKDGVRSSRRARAGALMMRPALRGLKSKMDYKSHGGAPLLGVNGAVVKAHGSSDARAIKNAVRQARSMLEGKVVEKIRDGLEALSAKE